jgi:hypothetical protein
MVLRQHAALKGCCILSLLLTQTVHADEKREIRLVVKKHMPKVWLCYDKSAERRTRSSAEGAAEVIEKALNNMSTRIVVDFTIDTQGHVTKASASGGTNKGLQNCIAQAFATMVFAPSRKATQVQYPIQVHTAGQ